MGKQSCFTLPRLWTSAVLSFSLWASTAPGALLAREDGLGRLEATVDGERFDVFTYHPTACNVPSIMLVFHGNGRSAEEYRDLSKNFADRTCLSVYAPLFDKERFPNSSYHRGGITENGQLLDEAEWTTEMVDEFVEWAQKKEGSENGSVILFGHSAGAQFLSRVIAYSPPRDADRIILANPSTYVRASLDEAAPYGFGLLPKTDARRHLMNYLAAPITVYLGTEDTGDANLTMTREAQRQGENRLERGKQVFDEARKVAEENSWPFNWRLVFAEGVGHSAGRMLNAEETSEAMDF